MHVYKDTMTHPFQAQSQRLLEKKATGPVATRPNINTYKSTVVKRDQVIEVHKVQPTGKQPGARRQRYIQ